MMAKSDQEPILCMYDPTIDERLSNQSRHWHPSFEEFVFDVGNKELTTIRIPLLVHARGFGYFEDRRPSSSLDPYAAADGIVKACIFGDFLKPEYRSMKELSVWDEDDL